MAGRIARLTPGFRRASRALRIVSGTPRSLALGATIAALTRTDALPAPTDFETLFHPGHASVRRVAGHNLWILYRFDAAHVDVLTLREAPPVPTDE